MSATEQTPETKPKEPQGKPNPTVRSVATLTGLVVGSAVLVGLFAVGGPLLAAGGLAAIGGGTYIRHRMKNPKRSATGRTKKGWTITWGSKSRRVPSPSGGSGRKVAASKGSGASGRKSPGSLLTTGRRSPTGHQRRGHGMTTRSRARHSAGGALPKHKAARTAKSRTGATPTRSASSKPSGIRPPKTATRTAAKPGSSPRLTGKGTSSRASRSKGSRTSPGASRSATRRPSTRGPFSGVLRPSARSKPNGSGRPTGSRRHSTSRQKPLRSSRNGLLPTGLSKRLGGKPSSPTTGRSRNSSSRRSGATRRRSLPNPVMRTSPSGQHRRLRNPLLSTIGTPGRRRGRTRFGNPKAAHRPGPSRSRKRPVPYRKAPAGMLLRQGLGLPIRTKAGKVKLPSAMQRRRARRTLRLRGLAYIAAARHLPAKLWDAQYRRVPQPPLDDWSQPTIPDLIPIAPRRPAIAIGPSPTTTEVPRMSSITDVVADAFSHISQFQAESATEVEQLITEQPEMFKNIGQHYMTLADRMVSEMPFDSAVADAVRDLGAAISAVGDVATQVHQTMRDVHEGDFARIENPRPEEKLWDQDRQ